MAAAWLRPLAVVPPALATVAAVGIAPVLAPAVRQLAAEIALLADDGWIMTGTGLSTPTTDYLEAIEALYLKPSSPLVPGQQTLDTYNFDGLTTPEQFCPFVCIPGQPAMNFGDSLTQGVADLHAKIAPALQDGDNVAVFGYSQSATIASIEANNLIANAGTTGYPTTDELGNLHIVLVGDPNNPIGGMLDRFQFPDGIGKFSLTPEDQHVPFVNIPLSLAPTPTDTIPTDVYTGEYDGWADFPRDPTNLLADINALIGIATVHPYYPDPTAGTNLDIDNVIDLGSIGTTHFYDIPAPLPLLAFMYDGGPAGRFFYDLFAPGLSLGINWAYGNPGDPFVGVNGTDAVGPWQVDASGQLMESGAFGLLPKMDPLQMLAGMEYAAVRSVVGPMNDLLHDAGQAPLSDSMVQSMLSGYDFTNQVDQFLLNGWSELATSLHVDDILGPDAVFDGAPLLSAAPLLGLAGYGFDIFNFFGA